MTLARLLAIPVLCLAPVLALAAGFAFIDIPADRDGPALRGAVWSPCATPASRIELGPIAIEGSRDCPLARGRWPLIVMSHGSGGSFLGHHDTAATLADAGFVVASISHPGDNVQDLSHQSHLSTFATRPVDMRRLVDYMLGAWPDRGMLDATKIGFFGFSRGGYTGLIALGALPNWGLRTDLCPPGSQYPLCEEIHRREWPPTPSRDPRILAAVIVDPLSVFDAAGLRAVTAPIQLWASEHGGDGVTPQSVAEVRRDLPLPPEWHVATKAGHFAFLAPCSAALVRAAPTVCEDGAGFDRLAFHVAFNAEVAAFFRRTLSAAAP
ncbi:MAG: dienelactone hydrolase [Xenophilus sp.]